MAQLRFLDIFCVTEALLFFSIDWPIHRRRSNQPSNKFPPPRSRNLSFWKKKSHVSRHIGVLNTHIKHSFSAFSTHIYTHLHYDEKKFPSAKLPIILHVRDASARAAKQKQKPCSSRSMRHIHLWFRAHSSSSSSGDRELRASSGAAGRAGSRLRARKAEGSFLPHNLARSREKGRKEGDVSWVFVAREWIDRVCARAVSRWEVSVYYRPIGWLFGR